MARKEIKSLPEPGLHIARAFSLPARTILTCSSTNKFHL
jgi:hypothetical protein